MERSISEWYQFSHAIFLSYGCSSDTKHYSSKSLTHTNPGKNQEGWLVHDFFSDLSLFIDEATL